MAFAGHFHCHDEYSPLDGSGNRNQLSHEAAIKGRRILASPTTRGSAALSSTWTHVVTRRSTTTRLREGKKRSGDERLIPILGVEAYWRPDRFMELPRETFGKNAHNWAQHLCLHAQSLEGWHTLLRLSSKSWVRREKGGGFYGKACMDSAMLHEDHTGIIVSTACISSPLSQLVLAGDDVGAKKWLLEDGGHRGLGQRIPRDHAA
jgi:DNA polymerase III alpha subunit